jgi:hypothetical protein
MRLRAVSLVLVTLLIYVVQCPVISLAEDAFVDGTKHSAIYTLRPTQLMQWLTEHQLSPQNPNLVVLESAPIDWITCHDALVLLKSINSAEPCRRVQNSLSSFWNDKESTIGEECRKMIIGYIDENYPPIGYTTMEANVLKQKLLDKFKAEINKTSE